VSRDGSVDGDVAVSRQPTGGLKALLVIVLMALAGCGGGSSASPGPASSDDYPYASGETPGPTLNVDPQLCAAMHNLGVAVAGVKAVKLKPTTRDDLEVAFGNVNVAMDDVWRFAPDLLNARVRTLGYAVVDLGLAVEDFRTTDHLTQAGPDIDRKGSVVEKALRGLRVATTCPA
jgi:hypothetical protein